ncbi:MAG: CvpA family protein [Alphaproteobacteria bacterium]|nr:CvpA family protein [Alphaproteobacteria bacterium]
MFNILDLVIIAVIVLSALFAAWRGFTRETLSIGAWVGAAIAMFLVGERAVPLAASYIEHPMIAKIAAYAAVFVIALIPLAYISYRISESVRDSFVGPVDRLLGLVFGIARGLVVVGIGFLVFTSLVGQSRLPDWFKEARLRPLMESSGNLIASLLPERSEVENAVKDQVDPVIGGSRKRPAEPEEPVEEPADALPAEQPAPPPKPKPAKSSDEAPAAKPVKTEPKAKPTPKPTEEAAAKPKADPKPKPAKVETADDTTTPRAAKATPKAKPEPKPKTDGETGSQGYGERERDALDQLIGSATASPAKKPSAD